MRQPDPGNNPIVDGMSLAEAMGVVAVLCLVAYAALAACFYGWMVRFATPMEEEAGPMLRLLEGGMDGSDAAESRDRLAA
jgi:hypothetical protein